MSGRIDCVKNFISDIYVMLKVPEVVDVVVAVAAVVVEGLVALVVAPPAPRCPGGGGKVELQHPASHPPR